MKNLRCSRLYEKLTRLHLLRLLMCVLVLSAFVWVLCVLYIPRIVCTSPTSQYLCSRTLRLQQTPTQQMEMQIKNQSDPSSFKQELLKWNFTEKIVILALVDYSFVDMAINFYETSLKKFKIENYLFVGASGRACDELHGLNLHCYKYTEDVSGDRPSVYLSPDFLRKMNIRTDMILDALSVGITVLHTDLDVVFLRNPLPELKHQESELAALWDDSAYNAGFLVVKPTTGGRWIYEKVNEITKTSATTDDQTALNMAINQCLIHNPPCKVSALPTHSYLNGLYYFETGARMFAGEKPCFNCTVVHNNWIVSKEAKVYRFKENLLWWNDQNGYFSSETRRYLMFDIPLLLSDKHKMIDLEKDALENALLIGQILNRTVILPRFHCSDTDSLCPLNTFYKISTFDEAFGSMYRESSFLSHPLVPKSVKISQSVQYRIRTEVPIIEELKSPATVKVLKPAGKTGPTPAEIKQWFSGINNRVLVFYHLYEVFQEFVEEPTPNWQLKLKEAFQTSNYRQYQ